MLRQVVLRGTTLTLGLLAGSEFIYLCASPEKPALRPTSYGHYITVKVQFEHQNYHGPVMHVPVLTNRLYRAIEADLERYFKLDISQETRRNHAVPSPCLRCVFRPRSIHFPCRGCKARLS